MLCTRRYMGICERSSATLWHAFPEIENRCMINLMTRKMLRTWGPALAITVFGGLAVAFWKSSSGTPVEAPISLAELERGEGFYAESCASCHGANLEGQADWQTPGPDGILPVPPHDETGHTWHHSDVLLFNYTKLGGAAALAASGVAGFDSGMPAFDALLTDDEIRDILTFIKSTWSPRLQAAQKERSEAESEL